jgi:ubiquitin-activating enzyme E1
VTGQSLKVDLEINAITRQLGIKFISVNTNGLFGGFFNDFGNDFTVIDQSGEEPLQGMIAAVSSDADGVVACLEEHRHGLSDGDYVTFTEVIGMSELNAIEPRKVITTGML